MNYRTMIFKNPQDKKDLGKFYPVPVYGDTVGLDDFVKEISHATSLTASDVRAVVSELVEVFQRYLVRGNKVRLDGVGTFKVSFKGFGSLTAEAVSASVIDRSTVRVTFVSDAALRKQVRAETVFAKVAEKKDKDGAEAEAESENVVS